ncbi:MAG: hypothetical protein AB7D35_03870, partial [Bacteroidales bacterium]
GVGITTISWLIVTYLTPPADQETLRSFYKRIRPGGPGWKKIVNDAENEGITLDKSKDLKWDVPTGILAMIWGVLFVYSTLFAIGEILYANYKTAIFLIIIGLTSLWLLTRTWKKLRLE